MSAFNRLTDLKEKFQVDLNKAKSWQKEKFVFLNKYMQDKQRRVIVGTLTGVVIVGASFGILYYNANATEFYNVYLDGEKVGTVSDKLIIDNWQSQELLKANTEYAGINVKLDNTITYEKEVKFKGSFDNYGTIKELESRLQVQAQGVELIVDGKVVGVVKDQATADRILNKMKDAYIPKSAKENVTAASTSSEKNERILELQNIEIKENVTTNEVQVAPSEVIDEATMLTLLKKGTTEEKIYTVQSGDTISEIAVQFGLSSDELYQLNPQLEGEYINIGDELVVTALTPLITVETEEKLTQVEQINYKVIYKTDSSMYSGERKVVTQGQEGEKRVEYSLVKENGVVIEKQILKETVLKEPVDKVILKGTKVVPSRGTGDLNWPAMGGIITSYFGPRWGTYHDGLDISGVKDYTIKAADNGKVTFTGWKGGYGKTVIIDHGNGMTTLYAHLSSISVSDGDKVAKGQKIGVMGNTGRSTGTHLHFEVHVNGTPKNPLNYVGN